MSLRQPIHRPGFRTDATGWARDGPNPTACHCESRYAENIRFADPSLNGDADSLISMADSLFSIAETV